MHKLQQRISLCFIEYATFEGLVHDGRHRRRDGMQQQRIHRRQRRRGVALRQ
jgi:hypothetical protein